MFVDHATIKVRAGKGGDGCVAFMREKYVPKGGPKGGDGGRGGDVVFAVDEGLNTLLSFRGVVEFKAEDGQPGLGKQCHGRDGIDLIVPVPAGTLVYDDHSGELLADLKPGERHVIAVGGKGGWGNEHFKTSTNQAPKTATPGKPGEARVLRLELKLIADVGLIGMPNAGKSTLLASLTSATPKIADYPFTTITPQIGVAELDTKRRLVIADIPGLIEGASRGAGLGLDFLRHIERTRLLVHMLDPLPDNGAEPADNYRKVRAELAAHSQALADKPELVVLNKMDLFTDDAERADAVNRLCAELNLNPRDGVLAISGAAKAGTRDLLEKIWITLTPTVQNWKPAQVT
jgi:GTP-binding protein